MTYRKKMIEVAIPLDAINKESAREKSIRHGHPSTLHLWWARRPLAACRAVLFTSLIDDPGEEGVPKELLDRIDALAKPPDVLPEDSETEVRRKKLFAFIGELVKWENTTNETVINTARELIMAATGGNPPPVLDPFCGGGSIPLEAQRLGLQAYASDLNPVAVLITKALIEIPPKFAGRPPVNPDDRKKMGSGSAWKGAAGLAADVRYYGKWMREEAFKRIGHLYPKGPNGETVIAWLWARTVRCPNPACGARTPLLTSYVLSAKRGSEMVIKPVVTREKMRFEVAHDSLGGMTTAKAGAKRGQSGKFECLVCGAITERDYVSREGKAGRLTPIHTATVIDGKGGRTYVSAETCPATDVEAPADLAFLQAELASNPRDVWCRNFGLNRPVDLFTQRQLVALTTHADLVSEARGLAREHALSAGMSADTTVDAEGTGAEAYADAIATYLALAVDKMTDTNSVLCTWQVDPPRLRATFGRQAIPMAWDFAEANVFGHAAGDYRLCVGSLCEVLDRLGGSAPARVAQLDASVTINGVQGCALATDPPYYDNIGYADVSDYFYVWLRRTLGGVYPSLFSTLLTPKDQELVALPHRFGGDRGRAEEHFEIGLRDAFALMHDRAPDSVPATVYYAFRQSDARRTSPGQVSSTGWDKMLQGLIGASWQVVGTWPMRSEMATRNVSRGTNALASSVVLACRRRAESASIATLREFQAALRAELPRALHHLIGGHIPPVDLAQAAIGPGMSVFSRYSRVIEPNGDDMPVRRALELINAGIEEFFSEREGAFDAYTQFCARWFEQHRTIDGPYGQAETLAMAKGISVDAIARDGLLKSGAGKVRLWPLTHYADHLESYDPATDRHVTAWEACHYLISALRKGGVAQAGRLAHRLGSMALQGVELSYRLYSICERNKWSEEALGYNALADSWPDIQAAMGGPEQGQMV